MSSYRRILVTFSNNGQSDALLQTLQDIAAGQCPQALVVRLIDTRSDFAADGPAASLPEDMAARRATDARRQLGLQLARMNLGWVETQVIWRSPAARLREIIQAWQPDLIIASREEQPADIPAGIDVLHTSGQSLLRRLAAVFSPHIPKHA